MHDQNDARRSVVVLVVPCRRCGAQIGKICRTKTGNEAQWVHQLRIDDYNATLQGMANNCP